MKSSVTISLVPESAGGPFVFSGNLTDGFARAASVNHIKRLRFEDIAFAAFFVKGNGGRGKLANRENLRLS